MRMESWQTIHAQPGAARELLQDFRTRPFAHPRRQEPLFSGSLSKSRCWPLLCRLLLIPKSRQPSAIRHDKEVVRGKPQGHTTLLRASLDKSRIIITVSYLRVAAP